jgi:hypothetical protein
MHRAARRPSHRRRNIFDNLLIISYSFTPVPLEDDFRVSPRIRVFSAPDRVGSDKKLRLDAATPGWIASLFGADVRGCKVSQDAERFRSVVPVGAWCFLLGIQGTRVCRKQGKNGKLGEDSRVDCSLRIVVLPCREGKVPDREGMVWPSRV